MADLIDTYRHTKLLYHNINIPIHMYVGLGRCSLVVICSLSPRHLHYNTKGWPHSQAAPLPPRLGCILHTVCDKVGEKLGRSLRKTKAINGSSSYAVTKLVGGRYILP